MFETFMLGAVTIILAVLVIFALFLCGTVGWTFLDNVFHVGTNYVNSVKGIVISTATGVSLACIVGCVIYGIGLLAELVIGG